MSSLTKGLVGHWDFAPENVDGGVVRDRTAYGNHGSPDGGVVYKTAGPTGAAVDVDGTGMIECGTNALDADAIVDQVSVAAWFNFRTLSGNNRAICGQASSGQNDSYRLLVRNGELVLYIDDEGSVKIRTDAISTDVWHHAVGTFVDGSARLYLDGQLVVSQDGAGESISSSPSPFTIGARGGGGDHYADGQIADVRAYNRALSAKEVRRLYNTRDHGEGQQGSGLSGIVAHWPLNDSGSVAKDVVGENDGAIEGGVTTGVNTPAGAGMSFDGSSGYVSCADHDLSPADLEQVSMCGWIRYDSLSNAHNSLFGLGSASENDVYRVWMTGSSVEFYLDGSGNPYVSTPIPSSSTWHHIGVVYGEGEQSIYINGKLQATSSAEAGMSASTAEFAIGARGGGQNFWDGDIADVRVYNRALTPEEIRSIYDQGLPVPESGLVGWWTLDESDISGSTAIDRSPNGNDGSINGSPGSADSPIGEALDVLPEEWVDTGLSPVIDDGDAQTIAIWAKKDEQDGTEWFFGDRGDPFYEIGFRNGSIQFYIKDDPGNTKNTDAGGFEAGVWYHNVVVVDKQDDVIQHYVNGQG